ncbi:hypothetical protein PC116_g9847 [Phytophthora cactorum]|uniref:Uncharacterized protein n=1 Tax=Phytophthora cactorum TaxID=29920 RepID=A0A8T1CNB6_9STRA|nr:hypothetical protein PC114_g14908 [Phytophthora cactorum]KAG2928009.1 hypothetical protein PC117_g14436 [Phytophthora cactorum]KAG3001311.1 hypothetical protein PC119_g16773 [Phytophthora cactorum]KAG3146667.1 hypothetical protein C6341_g17955 [Phytophthora cactorum]KAG3165880.1 hypothetical protein PC128_g19850 [Phytophthora cactorum]
MLVDRHMSGGQLPSGALITLTHPNGGEEALKT